MLPTAHNRDRARRRRDAPWLRPASGQLALGLECTVDPHSDAALRAAFRSLEVSNRLDYEDAIASTAWRICLRNLAEAAARSAAR